jgi:hypothetical protein
MKPNFVTQNDVLNLLNLIRPWHIATDIKVRIGSDADGGYVLPSRALSSNLVFSIGIGNEVSFDKTLAERGAQIIQFDHTIPGPPLEHPNIRFLNRGWGPEDSDNLMSLSSMMKLMDWTHAVHPILKFDTEGAEWESLDRSDSSDLAQFEFITGEFHDFQNLVQRDYFDKVLAVWSKLASTHYVVHLHANNAGGAVMVGGIAMPRLLELSYLRKDAAVFAGHSFEPIPGPLDRPNIPGIPDLCLRPF